MERNAAHDMENGRSAADASNAKSKAMSKMAIKISFQRLTELISIPEDLIATKHAKKMHIAHFEFARLFQNEYLHFNGHRFVRPGEENNENAGEKKTRVKRQALSAPRERNSIVRVTVIFLVNLKITHEVITQPLANTRQKAIKPAKPVNRVRVIDVYRIDKQYKYRPLHDSSKMEITRPERMYQIFSQLTKMEFRYPLNSNFACQ